MKKVNDWIEENIEDDIFLKVGVECRSRLRVIVSDALAFGLIMKRMNDCDKLMNLLSPSESKIFRNSKKCNSCDKTTGHFSYCKYRVQLILRCRFL